MYLGLSEAGDVTGWSRTWCPAAQLLLSRPMGGPGQVAGLTAVRSEMPYRLCIAGTGTFGFDLGTDGAVLWLTRVKDSQLLSWGQRMAVAGEEEVAGGNSVPKQSRTSASVDDLESLVAGLSLDSEVLPVRTPREAVRQQAIRQLLGLLGDLGDILDIVGEVGWSETNTERQCWSLDRPFRLVP